MFKENNEFTKEGSYEIKINTESEEVGGENGVPVTTKKIVQTEVVKESSGDNAEQNALGGESMSSVRRKYLKGKGKKINYDVVMEHKFGKSGKSANSDEGGNEVISLKIFHLKQPHYFPNLQMTFFLYLFLLHLMCLHLHHFFL